VPHKLGGVLLMGGAIFMPLVLITYSISRTFIPDSKIIKKVSDLPITKFLYFLFVYNFLLLGIIGGKPVEYPYYEVGQFSTAFFFFYFLIFPVFTACELS
jgi:quinol-cytochrome oxidoreductase complex cytochrome b subunit